MVDLIHSGGHWSGKKLDNDYGDAVVGQHSFAIAVEWLHSFLAAGGEVYRAWRAEVRLADGLWVEQISQDALLALFPHVLLSTEIGAWPWACALSSPSSKHQTGI